MHLFFLIMKIVLTVVFIALAFALIYYIQKIYKIVENTNRQIKNEMKEIHASLFSTRNSLKNINKGISGTARKSERKITEVVISLLSVILFLKFKLRKKKP